MTETVDFEALAAARGVKVELLTPRIVSSPGTGTDYDGFDDVSSVYVTVTVQLRRSPRAPSLTVLLEGSDDGNSWSTLDTFSFTNDGTQTATATTPNAHLRVSWSVGGGSEWFFREVSAAPASLNAPGGGSQPMLTADVPLTNAEIIALGTQVPFELVATPGLGSYLNFISGIIVIDASAVAYGGINAAGSWTITLDTAVSCAIDVTSGILPGLLGGDDEAAVSWLIPNMVTSVGQVVSSYADRSQVEDKPLSLTAWNNNAGAYSGGDAANWGRVKVWYTIESLSAIA